MAEGWGKGRGQMAEEGNMAARKGGGAEGRRGGGSDRAAGRTGLLVGSGGLVDSAEHAGGLSVERGARLGGNRGWVVEDG